MSYHQLTDKYYKKQVSTVIQRKASKIIYEQEE